MEFFSAPGVRVDGDSGDRDWLFDLTDSQLVYSGFSLGLDAEAPISKRNRLFVRASLNNFDYQVRDDGQDVPGANDDGTGYNIGGGWRYRFDNGFAVEAAIDSLHLGSDVDVRTFGLGLSYQFPRR